MGIGLKHICYNWAVKSHCGLAALLFTGNCRLQSYYFSALQVYFWFTENGENFMKFCGNSNYYRILKKFSKKF